MIDLSRLKSQASIAVLVFSAGLSAGGWGGWRLGHASADRAARVQAVQLARDNAVAVAMLRGAAERTAADLQAQLDRQRQSTNMWLAESTRLARQVSDLRQEIDHAVFAVAPPVAPPARGAPACPADPVGSPEFRRLYDRAAAPGAGAAPAASARPGTG